MTGLIFLTFVPLLAAVFFFIRTRDEQRRRAELERRVQELEHAARSAPMHPEWNAVLGHELRTPLAAILGYQELIEEGTFGELPDAARDSVHRIGRGARQLLLLVDAAARTGGDATDPDDAGEVTAADLCRHALDAVAFEAEARNVTITCDADDTKLRTRPADAVQALTLLLGAAIKASPGAALHVQSRPEHPPAIVVTGSSLDPERDALSPDRPLTGPAVRLELARTVAAAAAGTVDLDADGTTRLTLPPLPPVP